MQSMRLTHEQIQAIVDHAITDLPNEACGLIAGLDGGQVRRVIPTKNVASHPQHRYLMDAHMQIKILKAIEAEGLDWIGVYHSHPNSEPIPSLQDIRDASLNTPNLCQIIVSLKHNKTRLQAWQIHDGQVDEVALLIANQASYAIKPMSRLQIWAIIFAIFVGVVLLLTISFSLLPPAPAIPTPQ